MEFTVVSNMPTSHRPSHWDAVIEAVEKLEDGESVKVSSETVKLAQNRLAGLRRYLVVREIAMIAHKRVGKDLYVFVKAESEETRLNQGLDAIGYISGTGERE